MPSCMERTGGTFLKEGGWRREGHGTETDDDRGERSAPARHRPSPPVTVTVTVTDFVTDRNAGRTHARLPGGISPEGKL